MQDLDNILESVSDENSFLDFLNALATDREDSLAKEAVRPSSQFVADANGWENTSIDRFLSAAERWGRASAKGLPLAGYTPPSNPWRRCAEILYLGRSYEKAACGLKWLVRAVAVCSGAPLPGLAEKLGNLALKCWQGGFAIDFVRFM